MYFGNVNVIVDVKTIDEWYAIFLDTGFKFEYIQYPKDGKLHGWPGEIDEMDVARAREHDKLDISNFIGKKFTEDEIEKNVKRAEEFIESRDYPFKKPNV